MKALIPYGCLQNLTTIEIYLARHLVSRTDLSFHHMHVYIAARSYGAADSTWMDWQSHKQPRHPAVLTIVARASGDLGLWTEL